MSDWINNFDFSDKENREEYELVKSEILIQGIENFILNNTDPRAALIVSDFLGVNFDGGPTTFDVDLSFPAFFRQIMLMNMDNINGYTFDSIFSFMGRHFALYKNNLEIIRDIVSVWTCDFTKNIFINRGMESNIILLHYMKNGNFSLMISTTLRSDVIKRLVILLFVENMNLGNYIKISKGDDYYKGMLFYMEKKIYYKNNECIIKDIDDDF